VVIPVGIASSILRADLSHGGNELTVNVMGQHDVPRCGVCISNQGVGWLLWIKREVGSGSTPLVVVRLRNVLLPLQGGSTVAVVLSSSVWLIVAVGLLAAARAISRVVGLHISLGEQFGRIHVREESGPCGCRRRASRRGRE
jgi:hypothetical protein